MKVLYLTYGKQSNVIRYLGNALETKGMEIDTFNVASSISYRHSKFKIPSFKPMNISNTLLAVFRYRKNWKMFFLRTSYAFRIMTHIAEKHIQKNIGKYDAILQSGVIFAPSFKNLSIPYFPYIDHTYQISKKYSQVADLPDYSLCASRKWEAMERDVYEKASKIFTMSNFVKNSLINDYNIPTEKIVVVGAGPNFFQLPVLENKNYDGKTILFVGVEFKRKGGYILLEAFQIVRKWIKDAKLIIIGSNPGIQENGVEIKGRLEYQDLLHVYEKASVFALPSLREPFGLSFLEAMAYQLPCIGTNIEAIPEIVDDGKSGFVVPIMNSKVLAEKIILLLSNKELMTKMGEEVCCKVRERFNWCKVAEK